MNTHYKKISMTSLTVLAFMVGTVAFAIETGSELTKMNLKVCNLDNSRCANMSADKGIGSSLAPIHALEKVSVILTDRRTGKETNYSSEQGYLDLGYNRMVLMKPIKSGMEETIFDFNDLSPKLTVMK